MIALIGGELIKVRSTRTALGFGAAAVLLCVASVLIFVLGGEPTTVPGKRDALSFGGTLAVPLLIFGIVGATTEFRHRTLAASLLVGPVRPRTTGARIVAFAITGLAVGLAMLAVTALLGAALLAGAQGPALGASDYAEVLAGGLLATVLATVLGAGVGILVRNQVAAVVGALVWLFIFEPLLATLGGDTEDYIILNAAQVIGAGAGDANGGLGYGGAVLVLGGWAAIFVAAGLVVDARRDVE
jgi:ABC-2 type transport system permease protein